MMPHISGYEVCHKLRELYPAWIPIIMMSAKCSREDIIQGLDCRCNDYVTKPFDKEELLSRIDAHVCLNTLRDKQELIDCNRAVAKLSLPKTLSFSLKDPLFDPSKELAVISVCLSNTSSAESTKSFLDFLARKYNLFTIPSRTYHFYILTYLDTANRIF